MTDRVIETVQRLAETQQNLPVSMTAQERLDLREAARRLREIAEPITVTIRTVDGPTLWDWLRPPRPQRYPVCRGCGQRPRGAHRCPGRRPMR